MYVKGTQGFRISHRSTRGGPIEFQLVGVYSDFLVRLGILLGATSLHGVALHPAPREKLRLQKVSGIPILSQSSSRIILAALGR